MRLKSKIFHLLFVIGALFVINFLYAEEITILYTGETHAMLYPCNCPKEPDGGVARRATLVKQLRKNNPHALLLDSGAFFSGGVLDEYNQNTSLDMQRAQVNLRAMELMQYDAVAIGDEEFNFGRDFLEENIRKTSLSFISCNITEKNNAANSGLVRPYIIKEAGGIKFGITAVTTPSAAQKTGDFIFTEPKSAVKQAVQDLRKSGADIIVLLSHLGEAEDVNLLNEVSGIDILITGHSRAKNEMLPKKGPVLILRPAWQGRKLGKLSLTLSPDKKITNYKTEDLRLSDKIKDDPDIISILPRCFSDAGCKKDGLVGICQDAGALNAQCLFSEAPKINLLVIEPKSCRACDSQQIINYLKTQFPGLSVSQAYFPEAKAAKLVKDFNIKALPAYLLDRAIEKEKAFNNLKENTEVKGNWYMLKPKFSGVSYFLERTRAEGKIDLFISLYDKNAYQLFVTLKDFSPAAHFLTLRKQDKFEAAKGNLEVEDYLRAVCVQKYYPQKFWDYLICRAKNIDSSWWEDCLGDMDMDKIKNCARSEEGSGLLQENIGLNRELEVMFGPTYLLDNQEIFSISATPTKEDFKKIFQRK